MELTVKKYTGDFAGRWDAFVENGAYNGTFLQTRRFLSYHPEDRFIDESLIFLKGGTEIVAVIPACSMLYENKKTFYSHRGSTFGGIIMSKIFNDIEHTEAVILLLENYLRENSFEKCVLRQTPAIFMSDNGTLLEYLLFKNGYEKNSELSFVIARKSEDNILASYTVGARRGYRKALKSELEFREITHTEIAEFYRVLCKNLKKFDSTPIHTLDELYDLKSRLGSTVSFYGVFFDNSLAAGSMVFRFEYGSKVFHTQYLCSDSDFASVYPMRLLDTSLILLSCKEGYDYFSFGICTESNGTELNYGLANHKASFGAKGSLNGIYFKEIK